MLYTPRVGLDSNNHAAEAKTRTLNAFSCFQAAGKNNLKTSRCNDQSDLPSRKGRRATSATSRAPRWYASKYFVAAANARVAKVDMLCIVSVGNTNR
jgi:hypothetical protein